MEGDLSAGFAGWYGWGLMVLAGIIIIVVSGRR